MCNPTRGVRSIGRSSVWNSSSGLTLSLSMHPNVITSLDLLHLINSSDDKTDLWTSHVRVVHLNVTSRVAFTSYFEHNYIYFASCRYAVLICTEQICKTKHTTKNCLWWLLDSANIPFTWEGLKFWPRGFWPMEGGRVEEGLSIVSQSEQPRRSWGPLDRINFSHLYAYTWWQLARRLSFFKRKCLFKNKTPILYICTGVSW